MKRNILIIMYLIFEISLFLNVSLAKVFQRNEIRIIESQDINNRIQTVITSCVNSYPKNINIISFQQSFMGEVSQDKIIDILNISSNQLDDLASNVYDIINTIQEKKVDEFYSRLNNIMYLGYEDGFIYDKNNLIKNENTRIQAQSATNVLDFSKGER